MNKRIVSEPNESWSKLLACLVFASVITRDGKLARRFARAFDPPRDLNSEKNNLNRSTPRARRGRFALAASKVRMAREILLSCAEVDLLQCRDEKGMSAEGREASQIKPRLNY